MARDSCRGLSTLGKPRPTRGSRRGSFSSAVQSKRASCAAACGAPAKQPLTRRSEFPASTTSCPCASSTAPPAARTSAMPAATSYSFTLWVDTVAMPSPAAMRARRYAMLGIAT